MKSLYNVFLLAGAFQAGAIPGAQELDHAIIPLKPFPAPDFCAPYTHPHVKPNLRGEDITKTKTWSLHENHSVNPITPASITGTISCTF